MNGEGMTPGEMHDRERRFELVISNLLRLGVGLSSAVIVLGTILVFVHHPNYLHSKANLSSLTRPGAARPVSVRSLLSGLRHGRGRDVISVGLIVLMVTPVMRVAVSVVGFAYQRDRVYVAITTLVLFLLLLSLALGKGG